MQIQQHSRTCLYHDASINRMKRAQTKTKGDDEPLYSTVVEFLSLHTTSEWYYGATRDKKSYRVALIDLLYRKYTAKDNNLISISL